MPAYTVFMMKINDPNVYSKYTDRTPPIVKKYGGKFLTRGEPVFTLEGTPYSDRMVILEFPNKASVEALYADPEYQQAAEFRRASSTMHQLMVQEGGANTANPNPKL